MKPTTEFFEMCQIVFSYCMKFWNISAHQMGELIRRYKLASYVMEADDLFQFYGPGSIAELVEEHINSLVEWCSMAYRTWKTVNFES